MWAFRQPFLANDYFKSSIISFDFFFLDSEPCDAASVFVSESCSFSRASQATLGLMGWLVYQDATGLRYVLLAQVVNESIAEWIRQGEARLRWKSAFQKHSFSQDPQHDFEEKLLPFSFHIVLKEFSINSHRLSTTYIRGCRYQNQRLKLWVQS